MIIKYVQREAIISVLHFEAKIKNDAKCAAIAENTYGSIKQYPNSVFLTIGTGIGGAVFIDGKLLKPAKNDAFEIARA